MNNKINYISEHFNLQTFCFYQRSAIEYSVNSWSASHMIENSWGFLNFYISKIYVKILYDLDFQNVDIIWLDPNCSFILIKNYRFNVSIYT